MMTEVMKKVYTYIILAAALICGASCNSLDLEPKGVLDESTLLNSEFGVKKYLAGIYNDSPIEDFLYKASNQGGVGYGHSNSAGQQGNWWEALKSYSSTSSAETAGRHGDLSGAWGYWPYGRIRDINNFLEKLPNYKENFTEQRFAELMAEGRFLRALYYFGMVKRYGGVPIIDKVLDPTTPLEELRVPRDTEYDCWKFIYADLKYAMDNGSKDRSDSYRANAYAAAALMAKAMLYAGSVAKYHGYVGISGEATDKGLMGMDADLAKEFFKYAYDACKFVKDGGYTLHTGANKELAYTQIFIEATAEDIFVKHYGLPNVVSPWNTQLYHSYDDMVLPKGTGMSQSVGCAIQPSWELISLYDHPALIDEDNKPIRFESLEAFWNTPEMEPRCRANFFFSGMTEPLSGTVLDFQYGLYTEYPGTVADGCPETNVETEYTEKYRIREESPGKKRKIGDVEYKVNGLHGYAKGVGDEGYSYMGTTIRKYVDYNADPSTRALNQSWHPFKVFRYGEVLMNYAEAAYELGLETGNEDLKKEAFDYIAQIRERAGAKAHAYNPNPEMLDAELYGYELDENLQFIREERKRELCLENQSEWDQRRWRIAHTVYASNYMIHTLSGYYVIAEDKYIYLNEANPFGRELHYDSRWYYEQIPGGEINKNPMLIRNDGY